MILPVFLGWMSLHRQKRLDERKSMAPSLAAQVDRKCASQRFVGKICVCDPAQADSVTECGSTWPIMAFVSHPRLVTTAPCKRLGCWGAHARVRARVRQGGEGIRCVLATWLSTEADLLERDDTMTDECNGLHCPCWPPERRFDPPTGGTDAHQWRHYGAATAAAADGISPLLGGRMPRP